MDRSDFPEVADEDTLPKDLVAALMKHSPKLVINGAVLIRHPDSPTGWLRVDSMYE